MKGALRLVALCGLTLVAAVSLLSAQEAAVEEAGFGPMERMVAPVLGQSDRDLVYTPVTPCRIIDTRLAGGALAANTQRDFLATGVNLSAQGGSPTGCNIPFGPTSAVMFNFIAVTVTGVVGAGNLQAWAWTPAVPPPPPASILNFNSDFNIANGIAVPICDPILFTPCTSELFIRANFSSTHVVADVVGYFHRFPTGQASFTATKATSATTGIGISCMNQAGAEITVFTQPSLGTLLVRANAVLRFNHQNGTSDVAELYIGTSPTDCTCSLGFSTVHTIPASWPTTNLDVTVPVSCSFQVGPGSHTYYLNAISTSGSATPESFQHSGMEVIYNAQP
jgi:hypothetical protein